MSPPGRVFGSIERLLRHPWRALRRRLGPVARPVQAVGILIATPTSAYLEKIAAACAAGHPLEVDASDDRMPKKIRTAQAAEGAVHADRRDDDVAAEAVSFGTGRVAEERRPGGRTPSRRSSPRYATTCRCRPMPDPVTSSRESPTPSGGCGTPHRLAYHQGREQAVGPGDEEAARSNRAPKLSDRRGPDRRPGAWCTRAQPVPVQRGPRADLPVPAPGRLHRPDSNRDRPRSAEFKRRAVRALRQASGARASTSDKPGSRWPAPASPPTFTSTWYRGGVRHQLHGGHRATPGCCPSSWPTPEAARRGLASS